MDGMQPTTGLNLGWLILDNPIIGKRLIGQAVHVSYAVIFPERGLALLDIHPRLTRNAIVVVQKTLKTARFSTAFPGVLPIVYRQITANELPYLVTHLDRAFANMPLIPSDWGPVWARMILQALPSAGLQDASQMDTFIADASVQPKRRAAVPGVAALGGLCVAGAIASGSITLRDYNPTQTAPEVSSSFTHVDEVASLPQTTTVEQSTPAPVPVAAAAEPQSTPEPPKPSAPEPPPLPTPILSPDVAKHFLRLGNSALAEHNIKTARKLYEVAVDAGSGLAAVELGRTYDPAFTWFRGQRDVSQATADRWYARAREIGGKDVELMLKYVAGSSSR